MALTHVQRQAITTILTDFLKDTRGRMRKINVPEIHINPFLMRLWARSTGLDSSGQIAKWMVAQRLERGNVTAFGLTLKKVAQVF